MKDKRYEFSKVLIIVLSIMTAVTIVISVYSIIKFNDTTILQFLIPAVFAELSAATALYYWMIKSINKVKIIVGFVKSLKPRDIAGKEEIIISMIQNL